MKYKFRFPLLSILIAFYTLSFAQNGHSKFGKVSDEEMKMTVYEKDTSAPAVILFNYGVIDINYSPAAGMILDMTIHKRIKILTKDGLDYANHDFLIFESESGEDEVLAGFKAQTYNIENGQQVISKITKKEVFTEQKSESYVSKNFALPNVKVGSVIEYEYTVHSPYFWSIDTWYFQDEIPTIYSELRFKTPEYFIFKTVFGGYFAPLANEKDATIGSFGNGNTFKVETSRWVYNDLPAFKVEEYITTPKDYLARVEFEIQGYRSPNGIYEDYLSSWEKIGKDLMEDERFGKTLNRHGMVKELTEQINSDDSLAKKMNDAYYLIKKNIKWDESYGIGINKTLKSISSKKQGSMAEINLLLVNLLRSLGIEAYPVLISSRFNGKINRFYPRISSFNTVIALAKINGKNILMDATIAYLSPGQLTFNCINGDGLMVSENKVEWIPLLSTEQYLSSTMANIVIKDGQINAIISRSTKSLEALSKRQSIASEGKDKYIENYKKNNSEWDISEYTIENEDNVDKPLMEKISITNFNNIDVDADIIYLSSVLIDKIDKNPFSSEKREYPVDFAVPIAKKYILNITIPDEYEVEELPKNTSVKLPDNGASFSYLAQQVGKNIQITSQLKITRTMYLSNEYENLKELYKNIIGKFGEQIVLKKKI